MVDIAQRSAVACASTDARELLFPRAPCGSRWHCAWTHPQQERRALLELGNQEIAAYLPLHLDRRTRLLSALFPRYLFVRFDPQRDPWGAIRSTRGIAGLVYQGLGQPAALPNGIVEALIGRTSKRGVVDDPGEPDLISPIATGAAVAVNAGPLAGLHGICLQGSGQRVRVLLEILGRPVETTAERSGVELI